MNLRWRTTVSYLMASRVGSGPSQYQYIVFNVTNLAQVLSSGLVLAKILSRKLHTSRVICGRCRTAERGWLMKLRNKNQTIKRTHALGRVHTRHIQYAPSYVDGHELFVPLTTHPFIPLEEEIMTLLVPVGVWGLIHEPQQWTPRCKAIHTPWFIYLIWIVTIKEFLYHQPPSIVRHNPIQDLHCQEDPPGIWRTGLSVGVAHDGGNSMETWAHPLTFTRIPQHLPDLRSNISPTCMAGRWRCYLVSKNAP